jgi:membrane-associated phospholipid phosphatase
VPTRHDHRFHVHLLRPSHVLLRSRALVALSVLAALTLTLMAGFAHDTLLVVDRPIADALATDHLTPFLRTFTEAGSPNAAAVLSLVAATALWPRCRAFALALPITVVGGIVADVVLKSLVDRPRPPMAEIGTSLASFPSGHTIQATIVFGLLVPALFLLTGRRLVLWAGVALFTAMAVGVGWSRVALGAHWPSDTLGSFFIGASLLLGAEYFVGSRWARQHCGRCMIHRRTADGEEDDEVLVA